MFTAPDFVPERLEGLFWWFLRARVRHDLKMPLAIVGPPIKTSVTFEDRVLIRYHAQKSGGWENQNDDPIRDMKQVLEQQRGL